MILLSTESKNLLTQISKIDNVNFNRLRLAINFIKTTLNTQSEYFLVDFISVC